MWDHLLGLILLLLVGGIVIAVTVTVYPSLRGVVLWPFPLDLIIWGGSRVYLYGRNEGLRLIAGCLLILGGITRAVFQLSPLNERAGTVANPIPVWGFLRRCSLITTASRSRLVRQWLQRRALVSENRYDRAKDKETTEPDDIQRFVATLALEKRLAG